MTRQLCNPEGYKNSINNGVAARGIMGMYRFYHECPNTLKRGKKVWDTQFFPFVEKYVGFPKQGYAYEIGYGVASILFHAARTFHRVFGCDVHEQFGLVEEEMLSKGCDNMALSYTDGTTIPCADDSMRFVYSWTVFMHLGFVSVALEYLVETFRILEPGGVAVIYFSRAKRSKGSQTKEEWEQDIIGEKQEYIEKPGVKCNKINLHISMRWMVQCCENIGFLILEKSASGHAVHGIRQYHGQHAVVLQKPF